MSDMRLSSCNVVAVAVIIAASTLPQCLAQPSGPPKLGDLLEDPGREPPQPSVQNRKTSRLPVPDDAAIRAARALVEQVSGDVSGNPVRRSEKLLAASRQATDSAHRYVLLLDAEQAALAGGDHASVMDIVAIRAGEFEIDHLEVRVDRLGEFLTPKAKADPELLRGLCDHALETARRGLEQDALPQAKAAVDLAASMARSILGAGKTRKNEALTRLGGEKQDQAGHLLKRIVRRTNLLAQYRTAVDTLQTHPNDEAANGIVGRYLCFERGDWAAGLPALAKGDRKDLAVVAAQEVTSLAQEKPDPKGVATVAAAWWTVVETTKPDHATAESIKRHAADLYASVVGNLDDPLDKAVAEKRMKAVGDAPGDATRLARTASPRASRGWTILFRSQDPTHWNARVDAGGSFAVPLSAAPAGVRFLRLLRASDDAFVIVPMTNAQLDGKGPVSDRFGWAGEPFHQWNAHHLGIYGLDAVAPRARVSIIHLGGTDRLGWGFGHKTFVDDRQYYSWAGEEIRETIFEIAVKTSDLTAAERGHLLTK